MQVVRVDSYLYLFVALKKTTLVSIWAQENMQSQLYLIASSKVGFQHITLDVENLRYDKTWQQYKTSFLKHVETSPSKLSTYTKEQICK